MQSLSTTLLTISSDLISQQAWVTPVSKAPETPNCAMLQMRPSLYFGNVRLFNINSLGLLLLPYQAEEYNWTGLMFVLSRLFCAAICCVSCCYGGGKGRLTENNTHCCLMGHRSLHIPLHHCHSGFSQTHLAPACKDCDFCDMESLVHSYTRQSDN